MFFSEEWDDFCEQRRPSRRTYRRAAWQLVSAPVCASPNCRWAHGAHSAHSHVVRTRATGTNQARQKPARSITPSTAVTEKLLHQYSTLHSAPNGKFLPNPADSCQVNLVGWPL